MGRIKGSKSKTEFTLCKYEAANLLCKPNTYIVSHDLSNGTLYQSKQIQDVVYDSTMFPVYTQIIQMEALHLYETQKLVETFGGIVLDRNTDAIRYIEKSPIDITQYFWDDEKKVQKYKYENPKSLMTETKPRLKREIQEGLFDMFKMEWNIEYDYETDAIAKATEIVDKGISLHIDGMAGTGKSYITNKIIEILNERGLTHKAFSPTNKGL